MQTCSFDLECTNTLRFFDDILTRGHLSCGHIRFRWHNLVMLVYLNGTSSCGKTSVAKVLQKLRQEPYFYFSIDTLLSSLAEEDLQAIMGKRVYRQKLNWEAIFEGYFASLAALANSGNNVIADCPVYSEGLANYFSKHLGLINKKLVIKIDCPLSVLEDRERARGDRAIGVAKGQFDGIHSHLSFDLEVDSNKQTPWEIASIISEAIRYKPCRTKDL